MTGRAARPQSPDPERRPRIVGYDDRDFPEGVPIGADETPPQPVTAVTVRGLRLPKP